MHPVIPAFLICDVTITQSIIVSITADQKNKPSEKFLKLFNPDTSLNPTVYNVSTAP